MNTRSTTGLDLIAAVPFRYSPAELAFLRRRESAIARLSLVLDDQANEVAGLVAGYSIDRLDWLYAEAAAGRITLSSLRRVLAPEPGRA